MVIVSSDFYQDPHVRGKHIFEKSNNRLEALTPNFLHDHIKCYELHMVICQNDREFVHMLIRFRITSYTQISINTLKNTCLQTPPNNPKYHIYFTLIKHVVIMIWYSKKQMGQTFITKAINILHHLVPSTYHLPNDPN